MKNKLLDELAVCGVNAVKAVCEAHPETVNRLFFRHDRLSAFAEACKQLAARKRPYKITDDEELERICKTRHHQGIVAMIVCPEILPLSKDDLELWAREGKTGLVLHNISNDHNLGAIIRAAAFFDAHFIVVSEREKEAALTTSAYRVAEGGMEYVTLRSVFRTEAFLREASASLLTVGAVPRSRRRITELHTLIDEKSAAQAGRRAGVAIVLGNEEVGLPPIVEEACSVLLRIPGTGHIDSLNVSHAASLFLHHAFD